MTYELDEDRRREIFAALVEKEDSGLSREQARKYVAGQFRVTQAQVQDIAREGCDNHWPPLGAAEE